MSDDPAAPAAPPSDPPERTVRGPLRPGPAGAPDPAWQPPSEDPPREVGTLEQRAERRTDGRLHTVLGMPSLQAIGWILFLFGGLVYLHGLWATANAVIRGAARPEQTITIGATEFLQGTVGLVLAVIGLLVGIVFTFVPVRREPRLVPGTLEFEVAAERVLTVRDVRRILMWCGAGLFLVGVALAAWPLQQTVQEGTLYRLSLGGASYRIHFWGYLTAAVGIALVVPMATTLGTMERASAVAEGALEGGRIRRAPPIARTARPADEDADHASAGMGPDASGPAGEAAQRGDDEDLLRPPESRE